MAPRDRGRTLAAGAAAGVGAYVAGYLVVYLLAADRVGGTVAGEVLDATGEGVWKGVGWLFYNAHFVDTVGSVSAFGLNIERSFSLVGEVVSPAVYLLPPLLLAAAGFLAVRLTDVPESGGGAARSGAAVVAGYFPAAAVGALVVGVSGEAVSLGPDPLLAAAAGAVYPAVFGALGGLLARGAA